jgi:S-formylglutathione hydrolase FrmB
MALVHCDFFSEVLGMCMSMDAILPQQTGAGQIGLRGAAGGAEHPWLYLLHGLSDDHTIWQRRTSIERYVAPLGLAVVMPNVHRSFYTDMASGYRYWTYVSEEVPALARSFFRLSSRREDAFVAGLSMGGYGAFKLALRCPDRFAAAASLSGALDMAARAREANVPHDHDLRLVFGNPATLSGSDEDLFACAEELVRRAGPRPKLYQCCGTGDFLYQGNLAFRDRARAIGLELTYDEGPGEHEWGYWDRKIQDVLRWLPLRG